MNMEPRPPKLIELCDHEFVVALAEQDAVKLSERLDASKTETGPAADLAESVGARLQIRDFLLQSKGGLAQLYDSQDPNVRQNIANYLHSVDTNLTVLTGDYGQDRPTIMKQVLKSSRIDRLNKESNESLIALLAGFSAQESDDFVQADDLITRTITIRNDIVERLWPAAQTYIEIGADAALEELVAELPVVNANFDSQLGTLLEWETE